MDLALRLLTVDDAPAMLALRDANRDHFRRSEPIRAPSWFTLDEQRGWLGTGDPILGAFAGDALAGFARIGQITRGGFQNCYLGYAVGEPFTGRGIATALVRAAVAHALDDLGLHRVQANVRTTNPASKRVLEKAGFRREGLALRYLELDGAWVDHDLFAITAEDPREGRPRTAAEPSGG
jgi:[ribosomal protein S5]-alanine N-acetyltransferase